MSVPERSIFLPEALDRYAARRDGEEGSAPPKPPSPVAAPRGPLRKRKVPVVLQQSAFECGVACLAMILGSLGRATSLSECRARHTVGRDGVTAATLLRLARSFGLLGKGLSLGIDALAELDRPVIAHWGFEHYVVVEWVGPKVASIVDPAAGRRELTREELGEMFTGVVLVFSAGEGFERRARPLPPAWRPFVIGLLRRSRGALAAILITSAILQVFGLALPALTEVVIDDLLPSRKLDVLGLFVAGIAVAGVTYGALSLLRSRLLVRVQARLDEQMSSDFLRHLLRLPYAFFLERPTGDLLGRLRSNADVREVLTGQTVSLVLDGGMVVAYLALLLHRAPGLALSTLAIGAAQMGLVLATAPRIHRLMERELGVQAESQSFLVNAIQGIATVKVSGAEPQTFQHWSRLFQRTQKVSLARARLSGSIDSALAGLRLLGPLALLWVGARRVLEGGLSPGQMLASTALASMVLLPLSALASDVQRLQLAGAHLDRLSDVLDARPEEGGVESPEAPPLAGEIEIKGLSFRHDDAAPWVLRDIDVHIRPGQKVALVGRTGSGKSTLAMLLLGLHAPTRGEILFDGAEAGRYSRSSLRRQMGVVLQEPFLFGGSIRDNIALGGADRSLENVTRAARLAAVADDIERMPMRYQTRIAEGTAGLSGGQRQRIAIARALAGRPSILIFDEATSHLDAVTERVVDDNLSALQCTRFVIAHRLQTIRNADLILVLDEGRIVDRGTHAELSQTSDTYKRLLQPGS